MRNSVFKVVEYPQSLRYLNTLLDGYREIWDFLKENIDSISFDINQIVDGKYAIRKLLLEANFDIRLPESMLNNLYQELMKESLKKEQRKKMSKSGVYILSERRKSKDELLFSGYDVIYVKNSIIVGGKSIALETVTPLIADDPAIQPSNSKPYTLLSCKLVKEFQGWVSFLSFI